MDSLTQTQIARYLRDYNSLIYYMTDNEYEDVSAFEVFECEVYDEENEDSLDAKSYYKRMLDIAYIYTKMRMFSFAEDYTLKRGNNFINNDDLDLSFLNGKITGDINSFSNKKILKFLRDNFNHPENGVPKYKISEDCKTIEFTIEDNGKSIVVQLPVDEIASLTTAINNSAQTIQDFCFILPDSTSVTEFLDKLKIKKYCITKKIPKADIDSVLELQKNEKYQESDDLISSFDDVIEKEITLDDTQKENIKYNLNYLFHIGMFDLEELRKNFRDILNALIEKELSIPVLKFNNYTLDSYFQREFLPYGEYSYNEMCNCFLLGLNISEETSVTKYKDFFDEYKQLVFITYYANRMEKFAYSSLLFIEYVISNFIDENDIIEIDGVSIPCKKLRNSLVHGRWHIDKDCIVFQDSNPDAKFELEFNWTQKVDLSNLLDYCENVLADKFEDEKPKTYTKE